MRAGNATVFGFLYFIRKSQNIAKYRHFSGQNWSKLVKLIGQAFFGPIGQKYASRKKVVDLFIK